MEHKDIKEFVHKSDIGKVDKLLICAAVENQVPKSVARIRDLAVSGGLREAKLWNISRMLGRANGLIVRTREGWELTTAGEARVRKIVAHLGRPAALQLATDLRRHAASIKNVDVASYVTESIECFEAGYYRAAAVLAWVGAIALLYAEVTDKHLPAFNSEATRRNKKWKTAKTTDDLARMKEKEFLDIAESISLLGHSVKQELETCLKLRNGCGHPNSLKVGERRVSAHLESLISNVFSVFS